MAYVLPYSFAALVLASGLLAERLASPQVVLNTNISNISSHLLLSGTHWTTSESITVRNAGMIWAGSLGLLFFLMIVFFASGMMIVLWIHRSSHRKARVFIAMYFLPIIGLIVGYSFGKVHDPKLVSQIIEHGVSPQLDPRLLFPLIWACAGGMACGGLSAVTAILASPFGRSAPHRFEQRCRDLRLRVRVLRLLLYLGCIGPVSGVLEIEMLYRYASVIVEARTDGSSDLATWAPPLLRQQGRTEAILTGSVFALLQVCLYLPTIIWLRTLAQRHVEIYLIRQSSCPPKPEDVAACLEFCGFEQDALWRSATRALAVASPILAALGFDQLLR
jgi:hypothetical protein